MIFDKEHNCYNCKHGYITGSLDDYPFCTFCGVDNCYLCAERRGECRDYEEGPIPEEFENDRVY